MNSITIELEEISPDLTPGELLVLKCIYTSNKRGFEALFSCYDTYISTVLNNLQNKLYIKITGDEFEDLVCRDKTISLFKEDKLDSDINEVLEYLNKKLGKKRGFSLLSKSNRKFVSARLREKNSVEDLKQVIDTMYSKWEGTTFEQYLRPETLFGETKFQSYLMLSQSTSEKSEIPINTML